MHPSFMGNYFIMTFDVKLFLNHTIQTNLEIDGEKVEKY